MSSQMSSMSSLPPGRWESSRIASAPTCPLWRGVSSARNCASRLVSWRMSSVSYPRPSESTGRTGERLRTDLGDRAAAREAHRQIEVGGEVAEDLANAVLPGYGQAPQIRATDACGGRAQGERLEHVRSAAHAAVEQHRHPAVHRLDHPRERLDRG